MIIPHREDFDGPESIHAHPGIVPCFEKGFFRGKKFREPFYRIFFPLPQHPFALRQQPSAKFFAVPLQKSGHSPAAHQINADPANAPSWEAKDSPRFVTEESIKISFMCDHRGLQV
ncbi:MAG: hypothetical protein PHN49_11750 [Candidatus Omnitrophica bacterium]|nr:hypothetical protein [Candidatus Omnitrophota bacterium]